MDRRHMYALKSLSVQATIDSLRSSFPVDAPSSAQRPVRAGRAAVGRADSGGFGATPPPPSSLVACMTAQQAETKRKGCLRLVRFFL